MSSPRHADVDFGILLHVALDRFKSALHAQLAKDGFDDLGSSFGFVFRTLDEGAMNLRSLAEQLGISPQGALKIVDDMVAKRYVVRTADPQDKRATLLSLAPRGQKAIAAAKRFHRRFQAHLEEELGARRVADARAALAAIIDAANDSGTTLRARPF